MATSILARVDKAQIVDAPFPYVVSREALDPDYYAELAASFPSLNRIAGDRPVANNKAYTLSAFAALADPGIPEVWRSFLDYHSSDAFFREMLAFWDIAIARAYPDLEDSFGKTLEELTTARRQGSGAKTTGNQDADVVLDSLWGMNSPVSEISRVRGPHVDRPQKIYDRTFCISGRLPTRRPGAICSYFE